MQFSKTNIQFEGADCYDICVTFSISRFKLWLIWSTLASSTFYLSCYDRIARSIPTIANSFACNLAVGRTYGWITEGESSSREDSDDEEDSDKASAFCCSLISCFITSRFILPLWVLWLLILSMISLSSSLRVGILSEGTGALLL